jgi:tetratricopeptide (TPR) repeat protein
MEDDMLRQNSNAINLRSTAIAAGLFILAGALAPQAAFAAGGASGGNSGNGGNASTRSNFSNTCPKGKVWSSKDKKCVTARSGVLPDNELTEDAFVLAKAKRFDEALAVLSLLQDPNTPTALNYRGYVTRHLGRLDEGISYYLKSVALDPHYAQVREYLGEAYVIKGRVDLAKAQLDAIKAICGTGCEEYEDLAKAIADPSSI